MYILLDGRVQVSVHGDDGEVRLRELSTGDIFGEMALFMRAPRSATVRALGQVRVLTLKKREFLAKVHEDPSLAFRILQQMSERISALSQELAHLKHGTPEPASVTPTTPPAP